MPTESTFLYQLLFGISILASAFTVLLLALSTKVLGWHRGSRPNSDPLISPSPLPVSIIVPACNEEAVICRTVQALLYSQYQIYEIIIVNDGSTDKTLDVLKSFLQLREIAWSGFANLPHQPIRRMFRSKLDSRIRVVDKGNGGKSDALNAGIVVSSYPWFCCVDADTVLMPDALSRMVEQVHTNPSAIAVAGHVRVGNHSSGASLMMTQVVEYIRSFVVERIGWSALNGLVITPGAFSLFKKQAVCEVGGYSSRMPTEDVELVIKLHQHNLSRRHLYRVLYAPKAIAWTEAPTSLLGLARQRERWYRGLWIAIYSHRHMLFHPHYKFIGLFALPYLLLFELLWPIVEVGLVALVVFPVFAGTQNAKALLFLLVLKMVSQCLISLFAVLVDWTAMRHHAPISYRLLRVLVCTPIEYGIYVLLLVIFKICAFLRFISPFAERCGKWQTSIRMGIDFSSIEQPDISSLTTVVSDREIETHSPVKALVGEVVSSST